MARLSTMILLVLSVLAALPARAQDAASDYPSRPIKLIVAFPPGAGPDPIARVVAQGLEKRFDKAVIVENIPGGNGSIAVRNVARAAPDGYTLDFAEMTLAAAPHTTANFGVNPEKDLVTIGQAASSPFTFIASASLPVSNVADFVELAKQKPDQMLIGHTGIGTTPHLGALSFFKATGINPGLVSYRGIGDAMTNAMTGLISGYFSAGSAAINAKGNDKLKVLAVTGDKRMVQLPDVPTFAESNITMQGFETGAWFGVLAPVGTPPAIVQKISAALHDVSTDPDLRGRLLAQGAEFRVTSPQEFHDFLVAQDAYWGKTLGDLGIQPE